MHKKIIFITKWVLLVAGLLLIVQFTRFHVMQYYRENAPKRLFSDMVKEKDIESCREKWWGGLGVVGGSISMSTPRECYGTIAEFIGDYEICKKMPTRKKNTHREEYLTEDECINIIAVTFGECHRTTQEWYRIKCEEKKAPRKGIVPGVGTDSPWWY